MMSQSSLAVGSSATGWGTLGVERSGMPWPGNSLRRIGRGTTSRSSLAGDGCATGSGTLGYERSNTPCPGERSSWGHLARK